MRYLVTGGSGFIGSHLAEELLHRGHDVAIIDDLSTGRLANVEHLKGNHRFRCVVGSCADVAVMTDLVDDCDAIFHLAAAVGVKLIVDSPIKTIETNVGLTETVLALASARSRPVLIASSSEVYGKGDRVPFREDANLVLGPPDKGRWSYACAKALSEFLALGYWKERNLPVVIARLFNTVGPRQVGQYGMVVPRFVSQGLAGQDITVYGDGQQSRCFTHVRDVVRALVALLETDRHAGQVYNVGATREISIEGLAGRVRELTGGRSRLVFVPYGEAYEPGFEDVSRRVPDASKLARATGWEATIGLDAILTDVIAAVSSSRGDPRMPAVTGSV